MKVSVLIITYNHENFIAQALDSVLMQNVDFQYEIVVGEDCSTDATRDILLDYSRKFPGRFRLLLQEKNLGMMSNFITTLNACSGEYIAMLEGDDFWTSVDKLQVQVDFLDSHPECSGCFHNALMSYGDVSKKNRLFNNPSLTKKFFSQKDIAAAHFIPTCSTVFRSGLYDCVPEWFMKMPMGDWPLHILNAKYGPYGYLPENMAVYRLHDGGVWSSESKISSIQKTLKAIDVLSENLADNVGSAINRNIAMLKYNLATCYLDKAEYGAAKKAMVEAFMAAPFYPKIWQRIFAKVLPRLLFKTNL